MIYSSTPTPIDPSISSIQSDITRPVSSITSSNFRYDHIQSNQFVNRKRHLSTGSIPTNIVTSSIIEESNKDLNKTHPGLSEFDSNLKRLSEFAKYDDPEIVHTTKGW